MEEVPSLTPPDKVIRALVDQLGVIGHTREQLYLSSRKRLHRWAADSFPDVGAEFAYKAVWVAKLLRKKLGSPDHWAYVAVASSHLVGLRAAAWMIGALVAYVSLRRVETQRGRQGYKIVLGAMRPTPPSASGSEGIESHAAVWVPATQLIH